MTKKGKKAPEGVQVEHAQRFADALLPGGEVPEGSAAHLFALPSRDCRWPVNAASLAKVALDLDAEGQDVYVGIALRRGGLGRRQRGEEADCTWSLGVGLDLDVDDGGRPEGKRRFPDAETALRVARDSLGLPPTMVVNSGGGLHLWWLWREPLSLAAVEERREISAVARAWNGRLARAARDTGGWSVDSVFDLARILRFPGTTNRKLADRPRPVLLVSCSPETRYDPSDVEDLLGPEEIAAAKSARSSVATATSALKLSADARPEADMLLALIENDAKFADLWRRAPEAAAGLRDPSASGFDLALANRAVRAGWTDDEVAALLISSRRKHGDDLKLREDYYARTIAKAREGHDGSAKAAKQSAERRELATAEAIEEAASAPDEDTRRAEILALLSSATGVDVVRIVSTGRDPAQYRVHLRDGTLFYIPSTEALCKQDTWLYRAFEVNAKVPVAPISRANWRKLVAHLAQVAEFEPEVDGLVEALEEYLVNAVDLVEMKDQRGSVLASGRAVILDGGAPALHLSTFHRWLADAMMVKVERATLKLRLRGLGFSARTVSYELAGRTSSRTYWVGRPGEALAEGSGDAEKEHHRAN